MKVDVEPYCDGMWFVSSFGSNHVFKAYVRSTERVARDVARTIEEGLTCLEKKIKAIQSSAE